ncbi:MAG: SOS response-associated peptidase [Acidobacteriaceae bacterium]
MCGRYFRRSEKQQLAERFRAGKVFEDPLLPDYNIAPTTFQPVIRLNRDTGEREMALLRWGLVPFFASSLKEFKGISTINAKAESVATSATWREPFKRRRCLIPADGFYEWAEKAAEIPRPGMRPKPPSKGTSRSGRQPYAITLGDGEPMAIAGLWDAWKEPKKSPQEVDRWLQSFAMVTIEANELMATIHTRMPVILRERDWAEWLERDDTRPAPAHLLRPYDADEMKMEPANTAVGNVRNNGPEMLKANEGAKGSELLDGPGMLIEQ